MLFDILIPAHVLAYLLYPSSLATMTQADIDRLLAQPTVPMQIVILPDTAPIPTQRPCYPYFECPVAEKGDRLVQ